MLSYINYSESCVIVLHEIYGINRHIKDICEGLSDKGFDVICPNLLEKDDYYNYSEEKIAYHNFKDDIGFSRATEEVKKLLERLRDKYQFIIVLGFSIGATIAWLCSDDECLCDIVISYYGSRIRDYTKINPKCSVMLFFPEKEKSFNIVDLIKEIEDKENVSIHQFQAGHGFSDPYSDKYCLDAAKRAEEEMVKFIRDYTYI